MTTGGEGRRETQIYREFWVNLEKGKKMKETHERVQKGGEVRGGMVIAGCGKKGKPPAGSGEKSGVQTKKKQ